MKRCALSADECMYEDVLYMRITKNTGKLSSFFHYDIQQKPDIGMAIEYKQIGPKKTILIAGETMTTNILPPANSSSVDIFLLEISPNGIFFNFQNVGL